MNEDRDRAHEELVDFVLGEILTKRAVRGGSGPVVDEAKDAVDLAALRLVNIICELPARERPEGWEPDPEAATA